MKLILRSFSCALAVLGYSGLALVLDRWAKSEFVFLGWMFNSLVSVSSLVFWSGWPVWLRRGSLPELGAGLLDADMAPC